MTQAALRSIAVAEFAGAARPVWRDDLRFFVRCYAWGFAFFLALLS